MIRIQQIFDEFRNFPNRHDTLKGIFGVFQQNLPHFENKDFPLKGITVLTLSDTKSVVLFLDREYELRFSSSKSGATLVGNISVFRVLDRDNNSFIELDSTTFNGDSVAAIQLPANGDPIRLDVDNDCLALVLNWIYDEINS